MTDLRQRIEQVLREHVEIYDEVWDIDRCACGNRDDYNSHVADVLLSVLQPDIDTLAEAICTARYEDDGQQWRNSIPDQTLHRRLARAAINAMGEGK